MVTCMKVNGKITKRMDLVYTNIILGPFTKDTGEKISSLELGSKYGWIIANMKDLI